MSFKYLCGNLAVKILYSLPMEAQHLEKQISVSYASTATEAGAIDFEAVTFMKDTLARWDTAKQAPTWFLRNNAWNQGFEIAGFVRWKESLFFASVLIITIITRIIIVIMIILLVAIIVIVSVFLLYECYYNLLLLLLPGG